MLDVRFDKEKLKAVERALGSSRQQLPKVMSRSLNKAASFAQTRVVRICAKRLGWKQKFIRPYVILYKASYQAWRAGLRFPVRSISARALKPKTHPGRGVSYQEPSTGQRIRQPHAFWATMPSGHRAIFERRGAKRLPIDEKRYRGGLFQLVTDDARSEIEPVMAEANRVLAENVQRQVELILSRRMPR